MLANAVTRFCFYGICFRRMHYSQAFTAALQFGEVQNTELHRRKMRRWIRKQFLLKQPEGLGVFTTLTKLQKDEREGAGKHIIKAAWCYSALINTEWSAFIARDAVLLSPTFPDRGHSDTEWPKWGIKTASAHSSKRSPIKFSKQQKVLRREQQWRTIWLWNRILWRQFKEGSPGQSCCDGRELLNCSGFKGTQCSFWFRNRFQLEVGQLRIHEQVQTQIAGEDRTW